MRNVQLVHFVHSPPRGRNATLQHLPRFRRSVHPSPGGKCKPHHGGIGIIWYNIYELKLENFPTNFRVIQKMIETNTYNAVATACIMVHR